MKKVFLKYNPYRLQTEFTVDGETPAQNSVLAEVLSKEGRMQDWIEDFPHMLIDEYNDNVFDIDFQGTKLDFNDLLDIFECACNNGDLTAQLHHIPAQETADKEMLISEVFDEIQQGPFDELRDPEIVNAFENAKGSDFEVCVVATMSAGKSTLINSMLATKLMPSKGEACTAIITRIKDTDNIDGWEAKVFDKNDELVDSYDQLTLATMEQLNDDVRTSNIYVYGDIPFVTAEDVSLVLIDTPGPNNSRDPEHGKVQSAFLNKSSKSLVLYVMEATFGSDDDNALLERVAESMIVGGKQSKDRFIFVINKMDGRRKEDGATSLTLDSVRAYLKKHGIENPNLFPVAALPALNIRLIQGKAEIDEDTQEETEFLVSKLNRRDDLHLEQFASLPQSVRSEIDKRCTVAEKSDDSNATALIHTGIPSVEAAIRQYVQKYAKTAKVRNIVDTFQHKLEELDCLEKTKQELTENIEKRDEILAQIADIKKKIDDGNSAKTFKAAVKKSVSKVNDDARKIKEDIVARYQAQVTKTIDSYKGQEIPTSNIQKEVTRLSGIAKKLEPNFQADLEALIHENLQQTCKTLLDGYKAKLASLTDEIGLGAVSDIKINPLGLMSGSISAAGNISAQSLTRHSKEVFAGYEMVENPDKHWWNPFTWFDPSEIEQETYETVEYIMASELAQKVLAPIKKGLLENGDAAQKEAERQANDIAAKYEAEFARLDNLLKAKLSELENYATESDKAEVRLYESQERLKWLEAIQDKVNSILEI